MRAHITLDNGSQAVIDYQAGTIVPLDALGKPFGSPIELVTLPMVVPREPLVPMYRHGETESLGVVESVFYTPPMGERRVG